MCVYAFMHEDLNVGTCACANLCTHVCLCVRGRAVAVRSTCGAFVGGKELGGKRGPWRH